MHLGTARAVAIASMGVAVALASCSSDAPGGVPRSTAAPVDADAGRPRPTDVALPFVDGTVSTAGAHAFLAGGLTPDSRPGEDAGIGHGTGNPEVVRLGSGGKPDRRWTLELGDGEMLRTADVIELLAGRFLVANRCSNAGWTADAGWHCGPTEPAMWRLEADGTGRPIPISGPLADREGGRWGTWTRVVGSLDGSPLLSSNVLLPEAVGADLVRLHRIDVETGSTTPVAAPIPLQRESQVCLSGEGRLTVVEPQVAPNATVVAIRVHRRGPDGAWTPGPWASLDPPFRLDGDVACVGEQVLLRQAFSAHAALVDGTTGEVHEVEADAEWVAADRSSARVVGDRLLVAAERGDQHSVTYRWVDAHGQVAPLDGGPWPLPRTAIPAPVQLEGALWDVSGLVSDEAGHGAVRIG